MADVGARIWDYFRRRGYSPAAVAGILGNTQQESSNNPNAAGGGLIQGQSGRTSSGSLQQQLQGIDAELRGPERATAQALKRATTPQQAALIFSKRFERPGIPMNEKRQQYAAEALERYSGREVAHASAAGQIAGEVLPHVDAGQSDAQSADLTALLQVLAQPQQQGSSVAETTLARPASSGGEQAATGPRVPAPLTPAPEGEPKTDAALELLRKLSQDSSATPTSASASGNPTNPAPAQAQGAPAAQGYPLAKVGKVIGLPYQGTHTLFGNWESDNAVDLAVPKGTPVYATEGGTIGSQIGPLAGASSDPKLLGLRLHLDTKGNEWYYAHLSRILVKPGQRVQEGQLLGYSGEANGVQHLHIASKKGSPVGLTKRR